MDCKWPELTIGATVASRIKQNYFADEPWSPKMADRIGAMLKLLKERSAPYYPDMDITGRLHKLTAYTRQDMDDALGKEALCQSDTCGLLERSMVDKQS
jgi:hypothetical protein